MLVGRKKGRTIKALRERVEALLLESDSEAMGKMLKAYYDNVQLAVQWRGGKLIGKADDFAIRKGWDVLKAEGTILPADISQALVHRRAETFWQMLDWPGYVQCMWPLGDGTTKTFDPLLPMMAALPRVRAWCIAAFISCVIRGKLCSLVMEGELKMPMLKGLVLQLQASAEAVDMLKLEPDVKVFVKELSKASAGILAVTAFKFDTTLCEEALAMKRSKNLAQSGVMDFATAAVAASPFFSAVRQKYEEAAVVIEEHADSLQEMKEVVEEALGKEYHTDRIPSMTLLLNDIYEKIGLITAKVEMTCIQDFVDNAHRLCSTHVHQFVRLEPEWLSQQSIDEMQKMLVNASLASPLKVEVPEWQGQVKGVETKWRSIGQVAVFMKSLDIMEKAVATVETMNSLAASIVTATGIARTADITAKIKAGPHSKKQIKPGFEIAFA